MNRPHILVVDDEPVNLANAVECLADIYNLHFAKSGEEALKYLEAHSVDVVLLDIIMPKMDGFEVAQTMNDSPQLASIPVIYLTGDSSEDTIAKAFDSGAADYITKPFKKKELRARINNRIETERLKKHNEHLLDIIKSNVAYVKIDLNGIITEASDNFYKLFKCPDFQNIDCKDTLIGKNVNIVKSDYTSKDTDKKLWETISKGETFVYEVENKNFQGGTNWYRVTITPDLSVDDVANGYIAFYHNIDGEVQFRHDAHTDYLTNLHNRKIFEELLNQELLRALRYDTTFSLILADIDFFKSVNDNYGHDVGDSVLKEFSQIISHTARESDIVARWGGEEFVILCPNTKAEGAALLAENIREKVQTHTFNVIQNVTASFGVTEYHKTIEETTLFKAVDNALYISKTQGRNKVTTFINKEV